MKYNFKKFVKFRESYNGISIGTHVYLTADVMAEMEFPKYITVEIDAKNKAIMLSSAKGKGLGIYKVSNHKHPKARTTGSIGAMVQSQLPKGIYLFEEKTKQGLVFVLSTKK